MIQAECSLFPDPEDDSLRQAVVKVARLLIERHLGKKIVVLRHIAVRRFDWASPFFWTAVDEQGGQHALAMRYNNATMRWYIEPGTDQEWTFE